MATEFTTPVGRLVWGHPMEKTPVTDTTTKQQKKHPATGELMYEYTLGVAFAKNDPHWPEFYALLKAADRAAYPQFHDANGNLLPGVQFADKITDGDGFDKQGRPRNRRPGMAGHWIVKFASQFPPSCYRHNGQQWTQITEKDVIKRGYFVKVSGSTQTNQSQQSPGMYRNVNMVAFVAYGEEIAGGGDPDDAFGAAPSQLPPGASAIPVGVPAAMPSPNPTGGVAQALNAPPQAPMNPVAMPAATPPLGSTLTTPYPSNPPPAPSVPAAPYAGFMQPPPAPVKALRPHVQGTYEQYVAAGWTDDQLRAQGLMD